MHVRIIASPRTAFLLAVGVLLSALQTVSASESHGTTAILVDKKTNNLYVSEYVEGEYKILKTYHATLGKVTGDKEVEGDLKTPEGIYIFNALLTPPSLQAKFGSLAFHLDFPNTFDKMAGHSGSSIMLHATNEPDRLNKNYDSLGCVVVKDEEIREIRAHIRLGLTPILIFSELSPEFLKPGQSPTLKTFFETWIKTWESKTLDPYIDHYHSDFSANGKSKEQWRAYKSGLNQRYASIEIAPENVRYYRHPKYTMITFTQNYRSKLRGGAWGHRSRGTKILYVAEEAGQPKIIAETFTQLAW